MSEKLPFDADYIINPNDPFESLDKRSRERLDNLEHDYRLKINTLLRLIQSFPDEIKALPEYPKLLELAADTADLFDKHRAELEEDVENHLSDLKKAFASLPDKVKSQVLKELGKK